MCCLKFLPPIQQTIFKFFQIKDVWFAEKSLCHFQQNHYLCILKWLSVVKSIIDYFVGTLIVVKTRRTRTIEISFFSIFDFPPSCQSWFKLLPMIHHNRFVTSHQQSGILIMFICVLLVYFIIVFLFEHLVLHKCL